MVEGQKHSSHSKVTNLEVSGAASRQKQHKQLKSGYFLTMYPDIFQ